jgi:hypothetical protein
LQRSEKIYQPPDYPKWIDPLAGRFKHWESGAAENEQDHFDLDPAKDLVCWPDLDPTDLPTILLRKASTLSSKKP